MNLKKENLGKMNITSKCTVINQCRKEDYEKYKNFNIYSYNEVGLSNSRNRGLENVTEDIILLCDDDVIYNENYENEILKEFEKNPKADVIVFNIESPNRKIKLNYKGKRRHIYNSLRYTSCRIAFKRNRILEAQIKFNNLFGAGAKYSNGEDTLFLVECIKNKLKIYSSTLNIGTVYQKQSTWFNGYNEKFFFDKGALFTAISKKFRKLLILQLLLRHNEYLENMNFREAYKIMLKGSDDYLGERHGYKN